MLFSSRPFLARVGFQRTPCCSVSPLTNRHQSHQIAVLPGTSRSLYHLPDRSISCDDFPSVRSSMHRCSILPCGSKLHGTWSVPHYISIMVYYPSVERHKLTVEGRAMDLSAQHNMSATLCSLWPDSFPFLIPTGTPRHACLESNSSRRQCKKSKLFEGG